MKALAVGLVLACLLVSPSARADTPDDQYVNIYSLIDQGDSLSDKGSAAAARAKYVEAFRQLKQLQADNPQWNKEVIKFRLDYLTTKLAAPAPGAGNTAGGASSADSSPPAGINASDPIEFKIKWQVGKRYSERMDMSMTMDIQVPGQKQAMKQATTVGQSAAIKAVKETDGGGHELELEIQGLQLAVKVGGVALAGFDSQKEAGDSNPLAGLKKLIGAKFTAQADASGKIASLEGVQDALKGLNTESFPGGQQMISGILSENALKEFFDQGEELPDHPVKIGDTWMSSHDSMKEMGAGKMELQIKFTGWSEHNGRKCAVFDYSGKVTGAEGGSGMAPMQIEDGKISGASWFDPILGMTVEANGKVDVNAKVNAQGQNISAKMNVMIAKKILEVTDAK